MNRIQLEADSPLVDLVSFKWLMAGRGWWVDVGRLRRDAEYALLCAQRGAESGLDLVWNPGAVASLAPASAGPDRVR